MCEVLFHSTGLFIDFTQRTMGHLDVRERERGPLLIIKIIDHGLPNKFPSNTNNLGLMFTRRGRQTAELFPGRRCGGMIFHFPECNTPL